MNTLPLALSYQTKKQTYYLTTKNGWITRLDDPKVKQFPSVKAGRNFYQDHHLNSARAAFANRKIPKLMFVDIQNPGNIPVPLDIQQHTIYLHSCGEKHMNLTSINSFVQKLHNPAWRIMILDLEFYNNTNVDKSDYYPRQIAGHLFNSRKSFNVQIFDSNQMNANRQIEFLKKTDLPYSAAKSYTLENAIDQLKRFIKDNQITTILSWDNNLDFYVLHDKAGDNLFKGLYSIDLAELVSNSLFDNNRRIPTLKNFSQTLNVSHKGKWHDAYDDVMTINGICQMYYMQEQEL